MSLSTTERRSYSARHDAGLDWMDARLLSEVQRNNRVSSDELGEAIGLSPTAVQRRLKRLRAEGVIESDTAVVNPRSVGQNISMVVLVSMERDRAHIVDEFKQAIRSSGQVMAGFYVTGDADFVLTITAGNMQQYEAFTRRFFMDNPNIKSFKTMLVVDRVKTGFALSIDADRFK